MGTVHQRQSQQDDEVCSSRSGRRRARSRLAVLLLRRTYSLQHHLQPGLPLLRLLPVQQLLQPRLPLQLCHPPHDEARCRGRAPDLHSVLPVCLALHLPSDRLHQHPPPAARRQDRLRPCGPHCRFPPAEASHAGCPPHLRLRARPAHPPHHQQQRCPYHLYLQQHCPHPFHLQARCPHHLHLQAHCSHHFHLQACCPHHLHLQPRCPHHLHLQPRCSHQHLRPSGCSDPSLQRWCLPQQHGNPGSLLKCF